MEDLAKKKEAEAINDLVTLVGTIRKFEEPVRRILLRRYSADRIADAEGKRAVLTISGLKHHDVVYAYEITNLAIKQVEPMENYSTWIELPIDIAIKVVKRILSGQEGALNEALGDNRVKVRGAKTYHDMMMFEQIVDELTGSIQKLRNVSKVGGI